VIALAQKAVTLIYSSAVAWTLMFAVVRVFGNLLILPVALSKLPREELGMWYWFLSLAGATALIDMGFTPTMSRVTSYLWAGAQKVSSMGVEMEDRALADRPPNYKLLADLVKTMRLYYYGLGFFATSVIAIFGTVWLFEKSQALSSFHTVVVAWCIFVPAILVNCVTGVWHPLLNGINEVRLNQQVQVWGLIANYVVVLAGLLCGAGLYALALGYFVMGASSRLLARRKFNVLTHAAEYEAAASWRRDLLFSLWPTSWRTGLVTLGIYATLNASILICTAYLGPETTASLGLSSQLALAAVSLATSFVAVKIPLFAQMHARGKSREIAPIVFSRMRWFWAVYIGLTLCAAALGPKVLHDFLHSNTPLLPLPLLVSLFFIIGLEGHHAVFREITLTSHRNPFVAPVLISGVLIVVLTLILAHWMGLWGLILAPGLVQLCFNNWWTVVVGLNSFGATSYDYARGLIGLKHS